MLLTLILMTLTVIVVGEGLATAWDRAEKRLLSTMGVLVP